MTLKEAIYLVRPYSLPASTSPVLVAIATFLLEGSFLTTRSMWAGVLCFFVALIGQCFCNVVNDIADFKSGADQVERKGFERIVASGIVSLKIARRVAILLAIFTALTGALVVFLSGNLWLLLLGLFVLLGAYAYSAGPFPLAYNSLGEVAVFIFYGLVATMGTYYVATSMITRNIFLLGAAMGLASVNILLINNYRDAESDRKVGKKTIAVRFGEDLLPQLYTTNILLILLCIIPYYNWLTLLLIIPFFIFEMRLSKDMKREKGNALNRVLAKTAKGVLILAISLILILLAHHLIFFK